jgi:hypothetical protein
MKENILNRAVIACCLLTIFSCSARKHMVAIKDTVATVTQPVVAPAKSAAVNVEPKLAPIRAQQVSFNTFSGKAKTNLNINNNDYDCTLNIRISNNKKIWVSITAILGVEVARALITPDSIYLINKLQGVYLKKPFSYVYNYANKQVNYAMVQALLIGNAIPSLLNDSTRYAEANNNINLSGNLKDVLYNVILGSDYRVTQTSLNNAGQGQTLQLSYSNFMQSGSNKVPTQIGISSVAKNNKLQASMHYVKTEFNQPQDYPFNIPGDYTPSN